MSVTVFICTETVAWLHRACNISKKLIVLLHVRLKCQQRRQDFRNTETPTSKVNYFPGYCRDSFLRQVYTEPCLYAPWHSIPIYGLRCYLNLQDGMVMVMTGSDVEQKKSSQVFDTPRTACQKAMRLERYVSISTKFYSHSMNPEMFIFYFIDWYEIDNRVFAAMNPCDGGSGLVKLLKQFDKPSGLFQKQMKLSWLIIYKKKAGIS